MPVAAEPDSPRTVSLTRRLLGGAAVRQVRLEVLKEHPEGKNDGGTIDRHWRAKPGTDLGYRLWDAHHRRQPAEMKQ